MRSKRLLTLAAALLAPIAAVAQQGRAPHTTAPPPDVPNWLRLQIIGGANSLQPYVWLSPRKFAPPEFGEMVVWFSPEEYRNVEKFSSAQRCSKSLLENPTWGTISILHNVGAKRDSCAMPREAGCRYLVQLIAMPGVRWKGGSDEAIRLLGRSVAPMDKSSVCARL